MTSLRSHRVSAFRALASISWLALLAGCASSASPTSSEGPLGTSSSAIKVCPGATTVEGVDISHYDGTIDWPTVKGSGRVFAIAKATEGTGYVDPTFATNWAGMKSAGVIRGAYHFFHSNLDPVAQADHVIATVGPLDPTDLPITLDLEVTDGQSAATIASTVKTWTDRIVAKTGRTPIVYTSPSFVTGSVGSAASLKSMILWVANWGVTCPDVPAPYAGWSFWQYSATGSVPGIGGASAVDLDKFDGSLADLKAFIAANAAAGADAGTDAAPLTDAAGGSDGATTTIGRDAATGGDGAAGGDDATGAPAADGSTAGGDDTGTGGPVRHPTTGAHGGCVWSGPHAADARWASLAVLGLALAYARRRHAEA